MAIARGGWRFSAALFCLLAACSRWGHVTFEAKVTSLRRPANSLAANKRSDETVDVTLPGKLLQPHVGISPVDRRAANWTTTEAAVASIVSAQLAGDVSWIAENYVSGERPEARKQLADPAFAKHTRDYYRNAGDIKLTGWAEIREFTVMFLLGVDQDGDPSSFTVTLARTPDGWKQTNALAEDDTLDVVVAALHGGEVR